MGSFTVRGPGAYGQAAHWLAQKGEGRQSGSEVAQQAGNDAAKSGDMQERANLLT